MNDQSGLATAPRTVLVRIRATLPTLRPSERRIGEALLLDPGAIAEESIADLAKRCGTSTTTVIRFYKRIGYERFRDLRLDLAREVTRERLAHPDLPDASADIDRDDSLKDIIHKVTASETLSIADTANILNVDELARAVTAVLNARRIDIYGVGAGSFVGLDLQQKLNRIGRTALNWPDTHAAWTAAATLDADCVAIAVSHSGRTHETTEFLSLAQAVGATTVAITNFPGSPIAEIADISLFTAARETTFRSGALGSRIAQLMVVDCLFIAVAQHSYEASMTALRKTYTAIHGR